MKEIRFHGRGGQGVVIGTGMLAYAFVIEGKAPLNGVVTPSGNKNAAFPLISASLLTDQPVTLHNLPDIGDVRTMLHIVEGLGVEVTWHDNHSVTLHAGTIHTTTPDPARFAKMRGALVLNLVLCWCVIRLAFEGARVLFRF